MPTSPVRRPQASAMWTAAASWRTWTIGSFASSAASNTDITWLPESANTWRVPARASPRAMRSAPRKATAPFVPLLPDAERSDELVVQLVLLAHVSFRLGRGADRRDAADLGDAGAPFRVLGDAGERHGPAIDDFLRQPGRAHQRGPADDFLHVGHAGLARGLQFRQLRQA